MARLVGEEFALHMPLYRIEEKLAGRGIQVTRQALAGVLATCGERVGPLFRPMVGRTLGQGCIFTDDTPVRLQDKSNCREARVWTYVGGLPNAPPYHICQFSEALRAAGLLPKSKTAEAIGYMLPREANFTLYLADPNLRMDNNPAERSLRKLTIGRHNAKLRTMPSSGGSCRYN